MFNMIQALGLLTNPEDTLKDRLALPDLLHFEYRHQQSYRDNSTLLLTVVLKTPELECLITPSSDTVTAALQQYSNLTQVSSALNVPILNLNAPLSLAPLEIEKPWGKELWYTGIEKRGVCTMGGIPIPWILDCLPVTVSGGTYQPPLLLKLLQPLPDEIFGDLYFEAHAQKTEVYIVTDINRQAWPDGVGRIRYGFDKLKLEQYSSDDNFRQAYLDAVNRYAQVRAAIDLELDQFQNGRLADVSDRKAWLSGIDDELLKKERELRHEMESFTALHDLQEGDVVHVPPLTPHSLQHGVTVVEFQTPYYERFILSFAQKVLTQDHWDTQEALTRINLDTEHVLDRSDGELIADFDDFRVMRLKLDPGNSIGIEKPGYAILMGLTGDIDLAGLIITPGSVRYVPAGCQLNFVNKSKKESVTLLAIPK